MLNYCLRTSFSQQDVERFAASGSNVVVAKPNNGRDPEVAWVVFSPRESNELSWADDYGIYASNTPLMAGVTIGQIASTSYPAAAGMSYELTRNESFAAPQPGQPGSYTAVNSSIYFLAFGLCQNAIVNGSQLNGNLVSASSVMPSSMLSMTGSTTVYLWIQSQVVSNSVLGAETSPRTMVTFDTKTDVSLRYDSASGMFVPAPGVAGTERHGAGRSVRSRGSARSR